MKRAALNTLAMKSKRLKNNKKEKHLYLQLADLLRQSIVDRELKHHDPFYSHREVEERYQSNNVTVAKAMRYLINEGVLYSVPYKGCYVAPMVKNKTILLVSDTENLSGDQSDFLDFYLRGQKLLSSSQSPYELVPFSAPDFLKVVLDLPRRYPNLKGIIFFRRPDTLKIALGSGLTCPLVFVGGRSRLPQIGSFDGYWSYLYNEEEIGRLVWQHFSKEKYYSLGLIEDRDFVVAQAMGDAFCKAQVKAGGVPVVRLTHQWQQSVEEEKAWRQRLLDFLPSVRAVFCTSDAIAIKVLQLAHLANIKVPEKLAIVGVNDTSMCELMIPTLSSVQLLGERAVEKSLELFLTGEVKQKNVSLGVKLIERDSSLVS